MEISRYAGSVEPNKKYSTHKMVLHKLVLYPTQKSIDGIVSAWSILKISRLPPRWPLKYSPSHINELNLTPNQKH